MSTARDSKLLYIVQENVPDTTCTFLDRRNWSERAGHEFVDQLAFPEDAESIKVILGGNYFAACCLAAVWIDRGLKLVTRIDYTVGSQIRRARA